MPLNPLRQSFKDRRPVVSPVLTGRTAISTSVYYLTRS